MEAGPSPAIATAGAAASRPTAAIRVARQDIRAPTPLLDDLAQLHGSVCACRLDHLVIDEESVSLQRLGPLSSTALRSRARGGPAWYRRPLPKRYPSTMGLNIKNEHTTALVRELAKRTGLTQTEAIAEAVRAKLAELDRAGAGTRRQDDARRVKARQLLDELRSSLTEAERAKLKTAERQLYDDAGLPS